MHATQNKHLSHLFPDWKKRRYLHTKDLNELNPKEIIDFALKRHFVLFFLIILYPPDIVTIIFGLPFIV